MVCGRRFPLQLSVILVLEYIFQQLRWKQVHFILGPPWSKAGNFSKFSITFYRTYERGVVDIDITMACDIYQFSVFFLNFNDENNEHPFWVSYEKIWPLVLNYPWLLCRDRPAAARRCACYSSIQSSFLLAHTLECPNTKIISYMAPGVTNVMTSRSQRDQKYF